MAFILMNAPSPFIPIPRGPVPEAPPPRPRATIEIKIDGQSVSVPEGSTILDAARGMGIDTPTLCFLESLTPVNVCRVCVVELEGSRTPDPACVYCGNCIGVCPTGALMFKTEYDMRKEGAWDESRQTRTDTICPYCGVGCDLTVEAQDGKIVRVTSPLDHSVTHGNLCIKGRFGW